MEKIEQDSQKHKKWWLEDYNKVKDLNSEKE